MAHNTLIIFMGNKKLFEVYNFCFVKITYYNFSLRNLQTLYDCNKCRFLIRPYLDIHITFTVLRGFRFGFN